MARRNLVFLCCIVHGLNRTFDGHTKRNGPPARLRKERREKERINAESTKNAELAEKREKNGSEDPPLPRKQNSFSRFGHFGRGELHGADEAFAFFDKEELVGLDVAESVDSAAGPADFEELDGFGFADAEVNAQIVL
jgi:hypothetical protein